MPKNTAPPFGPLVAADWLRFHLDAPRLHVLDLRWYLDGRSGRQAYEEGHIPGAVFVDLEREITAPRGPGRHPIPAPAQFGAAMRRAGVSRNTSVVVYDDLHGSVAARLWWLLRFYGHPEVAVLDGGLHAWQAAGGTLSTALPRIQTGDFEAESRPGQVVDKHFVDRFRRRADGRLLDARVGERYRGEVEPLDPRKGHVPGAVNAPWPGNLRAGKFLSPAELKRKYQALGVTEKTAVVVYCGSGVTACHDLLGLELAGFHGQLYEGSWSDWSRDPSLPTATGSEP
jgi:thiosulfate/3-mercaptopyruvate sulfurtransferase